MTDIPPQPPTEWHFIAKEPFPSYGAVVIYVNNGKAIAWRYVTIEDLVRISHIDKEKSKK